MARKELFRKQNGEPRELLLGILREAQTPTPKVEKAGKPQGVAFERGKPQEKKEQLPKNYEQPAKQLIEALGNPEHPLRQRAEQALWSFATAIEEDKTKDIGEKGIVVEQASKKYGVPASTLRSWVDTGLIPVLYKATTGNKNIFIDEEAIAEAANLFREAKRHGAQPARLIKAALAQKESALEVWTNILNNQNPQTRQNP
jgi:DNA-binding transcriptional MerR regulator